MDFLVSALLIGVIVLIIAVGVSCLHQVDPNDHRPF